MLFDTPGQIEVFTWSASGTIITESLASSFPTVVAYIMDTARCVNPVTFMSNMLYACSIMYKTKLPFIVVLNKVLLKSLFLLYINEWFGVLLHPSVLQQLELSLAHRMFKISELGLTVINCYHLASHALQLVNHKNISSLLDRYC